MVPRTRSRSALNGRPKVWTWFCSHLAMKGARVRAIEELSGHADLATTPGYMHLSPAATEDAIRLLDMRLDSRSRVECEGILDARARHLHLRKDHAKHRAEGRILGGPRIPTPWSFECPVPVVWSPRAAGVAFG
jgi:hypothetical protein